MKRIRVIFEQNTSLEDVEVVVRAAEKTDEVASLIERISGPPDMLTVPDADGARLKIPISDIVSISICGKDAQIVTEEDRYTVRQPLQNLGKKLEAGRFIRISRYEIVNLDKVRRFDFTLQGTLRLELAGGMETWASRRNIAQIRKKLREGE